jgi:uncharacterized protein
MFDHRDTKFSDSEMSLRLPETDAPVSPDAMMSFVEQVSRGFFNAAGGCHAWDHTLRVVGLSERIARAEGADLDVVRIAAYLHDIGRAHQDAARGRICHARQGAELAGPIVARLPLTQERKENIIHCIRTHRFRNHALPETLEARVLFDADKLDAIGAVGIARAYLFAGEIGARLHVPNLDIDRSDCYSENDTGYREYRVKLIKIKDRMTTACGRQLACERHHFMEQFFNQFIKEFEGKG